LWCGDVGLGAAANAVAVLRAASDLPCPLRIISFDRTLEPLAFALRHADELGYWSGYESAAREFLATGRALGGRWELRLGDFPAWLRHPSPPAPAPHAILFDAFSPAKNPAMWTAALFSDLHRRLDPKRPCAMPTYSRSTMLRVTLLLAGFFCRRRGRDRGEGGNDHRGQHAGIAGRAIAPNLAGARAPVPQRRAVVGAGVPPGPSFARELGETALPPAVSITRLSRWRMSFRPR
jgi:hypothetical protein